MQLLLQRKKLDDKDKQVGIFFDRNRLSSLKSNRGVTSVKDLKSSFSAWKNLLGPEHVSDDENTLKRLGQTTFATCQRIPAIIRPANRAQVQECLRIANHYKTPVYPISRGRNWGYGSAVPRCKSAYGSPTTTKRRFTPSAGAGTGDMAPPFPRGTVAWSWISLA